MSEQNNTMEKFLQYLEKLNTRLDKLEDLLEISEDGQKRKQDRINAQKAISLKNQQKVKANNAIYPLTECGVIPYPIAVGNTTTPIPLNSVDNSPNQVDGFPAKFAMSLEDGSGLPVTSAQINACLYTATLASVWFTTGQKPSWQQSVLDRNGGYNKGAEIKVADGINIGFYVSLIDNNVNPKPTISSHIGWQLMYYYWINNSGNTIFYIPGSQAEPGLVHTHISGKGITLHDGNVGNGDAYLTHDELHLTGNGADEQSGMVLNKQHLEFRDNADALVANYSFDNSKVPLSMANQFKDVNMQHQIGYREIIYNNNPRAVLYYLSGGLVIFSGIMMTNADGLFSFNIPQLKTLTNLAGDNQVPVYCSIIQNSSSPNHNLFAVAELSNNNITITGKSFIMTTGQGINADIAILVIGILANYVGDTLAKIRAYKSSFYYDDLPEDKKLQLRQYYIGLDETKDLTKVTAPAWLEAELDGKELA